MNLEIWLEQQELLRLLAKRKTKNHNLRSWYTTNTAGYINHSIVKCYICNEEICGTEEHGLMHLKQSNLLPFI